MAKCPNTILASGSQVGGVAAEERLWARPEDMTQVRPTFVLTNVTPGSDLMGSTVAALAASAVALRPQAYGFSVSALDFATNLYPVMRANEGLWSQAYPDAALVRVPHCAPHITSGPLHACAVGVCLGYPKLASCQQNALRKALLRLGALLSFWP